MTEGAHFPQANVHTSAPAVDAGNPWTDDQKKKLCAAVELFTCDGQTNWAEVSRHVSQPPFAERPVEMCRLEDMELDSDGPRRNQVWSPDEDNSFKKLIETTFEELRGGRINWEKIRMKHKQNTGVERTDRACQDRAGPTLKNLRENAQKLLADAKGLDQDESSDFEDPDRASRSKHPAASSSCNAARALEDITHQQYPEMSARLSHTRSHSRSSVTGMSLPSLNASVKRTYSQRDSFSASSSAGDTKDLRSSQGPAEPLFFDNSLTELSAITNKKKALTFSLLDQVMSQAPDETRMWIASQK